MSVVDNLGNTTLPGLVKEIPMRVLVTGANGWVGSAVVRELVGAGHEVTGLVRSSAKGEAVAALGASPVIGTLGDLETLRAAAADQDGVIHTAFGTDFSRMAELATEDREAIDAFGAAFAGTERVLIVTSALGFLLPGEVFTERSRRPVLPELPRASEQAALALAEQGVRASGVRLARAVHSLGGDHGLIPMLTAIARTHGFCAYVGDGSNSWPAVHRDDAARLYRLALEAGASRQIYHAVAENVPFRQIAEAIGEQVGLPARSLTRDEADAYFGPMAIWAATGTDVPSAVTRDALGWAPAGPGLISEIRRADYLATNVDRAGERP
jgi:nucleoside-diphosphate-sugar epimerase